MKTELEGSTPLLAYYAIEPGSEPVHLIITETTVHFNIIPPHVLVISMFPH
jgi:hypothetical protein